MTMLFAVQQQIYVCNTRT